MNVKIRPKCGPSPCLAGWIVVCPLLLAVAAPGERPERRARLPQWNHLPPGIFFEDAFQQGLVGSRPRQRVAAPDSASSVPGDEGPGGLTTNASAAWTKLISADTIEDEIKAILGQINDLVANAGQFKGQGYRQARREYTVAAMLFAIVDEYPATVRWKPHAAAARDSFAHAAMRCKVGSDAVFRQAQQIQMSLQDLVRGGGFARQAGKSPANWTEVCERGPLMQRLEVADGERLSTWLASESQFQPAQRRIAHEVQLIAAIAEVLMREDMDDAADEDYGDYCRAMKQAAEEISQASERGDYESARQSRTELRRSCAECHATYRA